MNRLIRESHFNENDKRDELSGAYAEDLLCAPVSSTVSPLTAVTPPRVNTAHLCARAPADEGLGGAGFCGSEQCSALVHTACDTRARAWLCTHPRGKPPRKFNFSRRCQLPGEHSLLSRAPGRAPTLFLTELSPQSCYWVRFRDRGPEARSGEVSGLAQKGQADVGPQPRVLQLTPPQA